MYSCFVRTLPDRPGFRFGAQFWLGIPICHTKGFASMPSPIQRRERPVFSGGPQYFPQAHLLSEGDLSDTFFRTLEPGPRRSASSLAGIIPGSNPFRRAYCTISARVPSSNFS